jgi:hypothetical protein
MWTADDQVAFDQLREIVDGQLCPMFPGSSVDDFPIPSGADQPRVVESDESTLLLQPRGIRTFQLQLHGGHPFDTMQKRVIRSFVEAVADILPEVDKPYFPILRKYCDQEVVARSVKEKIVDDSLVPLILDTLDTWASQTYEGGRIAAAIGIDARPDVNAISKIHFSEFLSKDFTKVLTNGLDVLLVLSPSGHVVEHLALPKECETESLPPPFAPVRTALIARWSQKGRVAFILNRLGEILVLANSRLRFVKRRGTWYHLAHESFVRSMSSIAKPQVLRAVYETCLDVAFGRHGGCIAIAADAKRAVLDKCLPSDELISAQKKERTRVLDHCVGERFQELPRLRRLAVASADGAVILAQDGTLLAAGSIVRVKGGSDSGGRRAAAIELSRAGMAVKVSADGGMICFGSGGTVKEPQILFEV